MKKRIDPKLPIPEQTDPESRPDSYQDRLRRRLNELFLDFPSGTISVFDEGTYLGEADGINFIGSNVTAAFETTMLGVVDVTVTGSGTAGASSLLTVLDEGVTQGAGADVSQMNFVGTAVAATVTGGVATVTVTGTGGGDTMTAVASETVVAGVFVAVFNSSGTAKCRVAKASSGQGYQADGFVKSTFNPNATATIYLPGNVNVAGGSSLTAGDVFLGSDGYATVTAPTTAGHISQQIGVAESATNVAFEPQPDILIATPTSVTYGGTSQSIEITTTGTLTIPLGVTGGRITMVAAGGGGSSRTGAVGGGGGGAGESIVDFPVHVTAGDAYTVTIGTGGLGAAAAGGSAVGADGSDTSIVIGSQTFTVRGGKGGTAGGVGGAGGGPSGATGGGTANPGTNGSNGSLESVCHFSGSSGGGGGSTTGANGGNGGVTGGFSTGAAGGTTASTQGGGGGGAATPWGLGGAGGNGGSAGTNAAATSYGAGGGGAGGLTGSNAAGGNGADGYFLFEYVA